MQGVLAIDAGGTSTRAVIVDASGRCLGYGRAAGGNPVSAGRGAALASLITATRRAQAAAGAEGTALGSALIVMAGASSAEASLTSLAAGLAPLNISGTLQIESDLLGAFCSGTMRPDGYVLVAGTGAVAARIEDRGVQAVSDGAGWLLGDAGSGFWIGQQVARAVVAALDGRAPQTALTELLLDAVRLTPAPARTQGRPEVLPRLMDLLYAMKPVELARFAILAVRAGDDEAATAILATASEALAGTLASVTSPTSSGPIVLAGSILSNEAFATAPALNRALATAFDGAETITVPDGVVGAAVLALQNAGVEVDQAFFDRIGRNIAAAIDGGRRRGTDR